LNDNPFFSIIIPVFNVAEYLESCLNSVISQSFTDFEAILVEDGSTDGSDKICDKLSQNDSRIKVIHKENEGVAVARNTGINKASGNYILFLDSDDKFKPEILQNIYNKISETNAEIIVFGYERINSSNQILLVSKPDIDFTKNTLHKKSTDLTFLLWNKAYKKNLFNNINLKMAEGITFSEDSYITLALQNQTNNFAFIPETGYSYLCRATSVTQNMNIKNHLDRLKAVTLMDELYKSNKDKPSVLNNIKFDTKFFYIDPKYDYSKSELLHNFKLWRKTFPESTHCFTNKIANKKIMIYVKLITFHMDLFANILFQLNKKNRNKG